MSQIYKSGSSSGPVPPTVATSYVTDTNSPAVPAANVLNVLGNDSITSNDNGIYTDGSSGGNTLTVFLSNRAVITAVTSDGAGQTQTVNILTTTNGTSQIFRVLTTGYDAVNNVTTGAETLGSSRTTAGTTTIIGTNDVFLEEDAALGATQYNIIQSANILQIQFIGIAGRTITWKALFEYIQT